MDDVIENLRKRRFYLLMRKIELETQLPEALCRFRIVGVDQKRMTSATD